MNNGKQYLVTAEEMQRYDTCTINRIGIPSMVLMERAALAALEEIERRRGPLTGQNILVLAGPGNNGADALALSRLFAGRGANVDVVCRAESTGTKKEWLAWKSILEYYPVRIGRNPQPKEYTILIDGLFGSGLNRDMTGDYADYIKYFNQSHGYKVALDMPSGIHTDSGKVMGTAAKCDLTVTFAFPKRGLCLPPGKAYAGEVVCKDIGIGEEAFNGQPPQMYRYVEGTENLLPTRDPEGNKGTFGKVLVVAGSRNMAGAAILAGRGAFRSGAGMVKLLSSPDNRDILQTAVPEALFGTQEDWDTSLMWADCIAAGSGLGRSEEAVEWISKLITDSDLPLLLDGDALTLLTEHRELGDRLANAGTQGRSIILTPHMGELSRLLRVPMERLKEERVAYVRQLAGQYHCVVIGKDSVTAICGETGPVCLHTAGNSGMATAGSGDVLAGIVAGLLSQIPDPFEAAVRGVYLHGRAGDAAAQAIGEAPLMASDIIEGMTLIKTCDFRAVTKS
jgi:NAD(P)H-hydrate epimerase